MEEAGHIAAGEDPGAVHNLVVGDNLPADPEADTDCAKEGHKKVVVEDDSPLVAAAEGRDCEMGHYTVVVEEGSPVEAEDLEEGSPGEGIDSGEVVRSRNHPLQLS